jgi:hypothetical protein
MLPKTKILKVIFLFPVRNLSSNKIKNENAEYKNVKIPHITK